MPVTASRPLRRLGLCLTLALLCGAGVWWWAPTPAPALQPAAPATWPNAAPAKLTATTGASNPWDLLAAAERTADIAMPSLPKVKPSMSEADWQAFDKQWCVAMQPVRGAVQANQPVPLSLAAWATPSEAEQRRIASELAQRTAKILLSRPDTRSRAVGLWWLGKFNPESTPTPTSHLQLMALAESTRDPLAAALAAQSVQESTLRRRAVALWQALEPGNLAPLLLAQDDDKLSLDTLLARAANATSNRKWHKEAFKTLHEVAPPTAGGYAELLQEVSAVGVHAAQAVQLHMVAQPCRQPASPERAAKCAQAAQRIWELEPDSTVDALLAVSMVRAQPTLHPQWADRARTVEAAMASQRAIAAIVDGLVRRTACLSDPASQGFMVDRLTQGEWHHTQAQLPTDPAALAGLVAQYRSTRGGRGLLDPTPLPKPHPASPR